MWFEARGKKTKRRKGRRKQSNRHKFSVLGVKTRRATVKGHQRTQKVLVVAFLVLVLLGAMALAGLGLKAAGEVIFSKNERFTIRHLEIRTDPGAVITPMLVREYVDISEGTNTFAVDIQKVRRDFLKRAPNVKSMEITRILPDRLLIELHERVPIAHIKQRRAADVHVDEHGFLFAARPRKGRLPVITGYTGPRLKRGECVEGILRDAVVLLAENNRLQATEDIAVVSLNVRGGFEGREDSMRMYLARKTMVDFWWVRRRQGGMKGSKDLVARLRHLRNVVLPEAKRRGCRTVNLTLDRYRENCPITVW